MTINTIRELLSWKQSHAISLCNLHCLAPHVTDNRRWYDELGSSNSSACLLAGTSQLNWRETMTCWCTRLYTPKGRAGFRLHTPICSVRWASLIHYIMLALTLCLPGLFGCPIYCKFIFNTTIIIHSLLYNEYRYLPGGKGGRGVLLTTHPLPVLWVRKERGYPTSPQCARSGS
jgi:hypothetical protein